MNIATSISPVSSGYEASYKKKDNKMLVLWSIWMLTCIINIFKIYKHGGVFEFSDIVWPLCLITYSLAIANILFTKNTFSVHGKLLTVTSRALFYNKVKVYDVDRMEDIQAEQLMIKKFLPTRMEPSGEYNIFFSYDEKEEKLPAIPAKVYTEQLMDAVMMAKQAKA